MLFYYSILENVLDTKTFREFAGKTDVRFTTHAINRLKESQLDIKRGKHLLYEAIHSPFKLLWESKKYTTNKDEITYWMNAVLTYTVIKTKHKNTGQEIYLVLTVTDSRCVDMYRGVREEFK